MMGQSQAAFDGADRAVHNDPKLVMGWVVRGRAAIALGKMDMAELSFAKAIALDPEAAQPLKAELREASGKGSAPEAIPAAQPQAAPAGNPISGTVELDPSVGTPPDGAFVFVIARDAASPSPMPAAAKRLPARDFPLHFTLGAEDAVMGRPLPDRITLEARLDTDGNATTRAPTDPIARQEQVSMGTSGLKLVLRAP
jgi:tetratricopeptide (TPR) repeat protein